MPFPPAIRLGNAILLACALFPIAACATSASSSGTSPKGSWSQSRQRPAAGILHTVQPGDTLWKISRAYGVSMEDIVVANELSSESRISVGQKLLIPGATRPLTSASPKSSSASSTGASPKSAPAPQKRSAASAASPKASAAPEKAAGRSDSAGKARVPTPLKTKADDEGKSAAASSDGSASSAALPFLPVDASASRQYLPPPGTSDKPLSWPVRGVLYAKFGKRGQSVHDGIDIAAPEATPIRSAAAGKVLYSAFQKGYGNLIIVEHAGGILTLYAHNRENLVKEGDKVRLGQVIARMGTGTETSGPYLHFEVRIAGEPHNPLNYLPPPK